MNEKADCFLMGTSQALKYDNERDFKSVPLTKTQQEKIWLAVMEMKR